MSWLKWIKEKLKTVRWLYQLVRKVKTFPWVFYHTYFLTVKFYIERILRKIGILKKDEFVEKIKNCHKGEQIVIVATGPSLTIDDLQVLKERNITTIAVNRIHQIYKQTDWRPTYYMMTDAIGYQYNPEVFQGVILEDNAVEGALISDILYKALKYKPNRKRLGVLPICYFDHWSNNETTRFRYDKNIAYGLYDFCTITNSAINFADYLGAREIFLLGVDNNYAQPTPRIGDMPREVTEQDIQHAKKTADRMNVGYEAIKKLIGRDIKIYNATRGGNLEVFERVDFDEVFRKSKKKVD